MKTVLLRLLPHAYIITMGLKKKKNRLSGKGIHPPNVPFPIKLRNKALLGKSLQC